VIAHALEPLMIPQQAITTSDRGACPAGVLLLRSCLVPGAARGIPNVPDYFAFSVRGRRPWDLVRFVLQSFP